MLTEAAGIPLAVEIDGANRHDCKLVEVTLMNMKRLNPPPTEAAPQQLCVLTAAMTTTACARWWP